ncbi:MAG: ThaI family type II restriction endonuclease [Armatimonadota bacterium]|nr:ThaI family type II restriction endonuclease [Armatimonadota bacterium]MCX7776528.1 ThaI family type II restriction endonuclease [Armatimonadota bacterium]MDW8024327.1 ThaI family type II restriction endonuclease [Armatimonadota bacterium]
MSKVSVLYKRAVKPVQTQLPPISAIIVLTLLASFNSILALHSKPSDESSTSGSEKAIVNERNITCLFDDDAFNERIRRKLPLLFHIAEKHASRAGKVGMEVGVLREQILISMLIYKFGRPYVDVNTPSNFPEADVTLFGKPVSIKTVTVRSNNIPAIKLVWTVDWLKVESFVKAYEPRSDLLVAIIRWNGTGGLFAIPVGAQREVLQTLGKERYLKLPPKGTNPRGVELSQEALAMLLRHKLTRHIEIKWERPSQYDDLEPYIRWLAYWAED